MTAGGGRPNCPEAANSASRETGTGQEFNEFRVDPRRLDRGDTGRPPASQLSTCIESVLFSRVGRHPSGCFWKGFTVSG